MGWKMKKKKTIQFYFTGSALRNADNKYRVIILIFLPDL